MSARLLVVDDEASVRTTVAMLLRAVGHEVTEADSGASALAALACEPFDVVLLDLRMPGMTGMQTWARMQALGRSLPVTVLMTAAVDGPAVAAEHGMRLLAKPFGFEALLSVVDGALARPRAR